MEKVLVTGHTGMLGRRVIETLVATGRYRVFGVSRDSKLENTDITQFQADLAQRDNTIRLLTDVVPDVIVHTAAITNLRYCEQHVHEAHGFHVGLTRTLANFRKCRLIYISTDSVFNGARGNYQETDPTYPLNYYAQSKLQGEWAALDENPATLILRTNIYGHKTPSGHSLAEWALESFRQGNQISGFTDVLFNPLYVGQLARLIVELMSSTHNGILHTGSADSYSKMEFLRLLAEEFGYPSSLVRESVYIEDPVLRRPKNTILNVDRLKTVSDAVPTLHSGMEEFKKDYLRDYPL